MRILFFASDLTKPSHLWMRRMARELKGYIPLIVDDVTGNSAATFDGIPVERVPSNVSLKAVAHRFSCLLHSSRSAYRADWLKSMVFESAADVVLVHFLTQAVRYTDVWEQIDLPVHVHCHGYDVSWDLRRSGSGKLVHSPSYIDRVRRLPANVTFIANSRYTAGRLQEVGIDHSRIRVKRFGIKASTIPLPIADQPPHLIFLGRLIDCKGPLETLRAFNSVLSRQPDARLTIAGSGELLDASEAYVAANGLSDSVSLVGAVSEAEGAKLRQQATAFTAHNRRGVSTNQEEAFGLALLEAMSCGLPVVTGRSGGVAEFVRHGETGFLFEPGNVNEHAYYLDLLLSDPQLAVRIGRQAWEYVKRMHRPEVELAYIINQFKGSLAAA